MKVRSETVDGVLIVEAQGRIDGTHAGDFKRAVRSVTDGHEGPVILDYGQVDYMSSAGLRALLIIASSVMVRDASFAVCSPSELIAHLLRLSGFDQVIATVASRDEALASIHG